MSGAGRKQAEKDALLQTGEALGLFVKRCFLGTKKKYGGLLGSLYVYCRKNLWRVKAGSSLSASVQGQGACVRKVFRKKS